MALVVTARAPAQSAAGLAHVWRALAVACATGYAFTIVVEAANRAVPDAEWLSAAALIADGVGTVLAIAGCVAVWVVARDNAGLLLAATLAPVLVALRLVLTAVLVTLDMSTLADEVGAGLGALALAALVWTAAAPKMVAGARASRQGKLFQRVAEVTALVFFAVLLSGATVRSVGASWACIGTFPDCNGLGALPFGHDPSADIQLYHRLLSYVALGLVLWLTIEAFRSQPVVLARAAVALLGVTLVDAVVGALLVSLGTPPIGEVAHAAASATTWSAAVVLVALSRAQTLIVPAEVAPSRRLALATAYVQLTKPRVMSLLLATTAAAMVIASRGMPEIGVLIATLIGGALMSGGAGAINHYVDRDIDPLMGRTAWRPIPSGVIAPKDALRFGIALAFVASAVFIIFVNALACALALLGLLGYVFIYTLWLKRSTPSNIVIGGAAGAIPPLVGWAAVTNEISSLTAWYLFAIIFFWTPPHFWALSLLIRKHYERAGVPMLPVVRGEDETRRQIVLYSVLLVVLTLVLSPFGMMGTIYFGASALLGALFIVDAIRLWRQRTSLAARRLYLYSILYLFALFAAMAVDRSV